MGDSRNGRRAWPDQLKHVQQSQSSGCAFSAIVADGSVVSWGDVDFSVVQDQLVDVQQIQASDNAVAAVLGDGSVVTWGGAREGGDGSAVQDQLKIVKDI